MNIYATLVAAIIPLMIGAVWYNPKVFGNAWMVQSGLTPEEVQGGNMLKIFGFTFLFSLFLALIMNSMVIHQMHIDSLLMNEPGFNDPDSAIGQLKASLMNDFGDNFRTFNHGVIHGIILTIFFVLPVLGINALFERKSFKYIFINVGFWLISLCLMGGIICVWK